MKPIDDLAQFRTLAQALPPARFTGSGIIHPRISLFAASRTDADVDRLLGQVADLPFDSDIAAVVAQADADLRLYELAIGTPSTALGAVDAARTAAYGMTAIEPGPDLFALGCLGDAPDQLKTVLENIGDPLALLATACSRDVVAVFGALMAARMAGLPVIVDGANTMAAALLLQRLAPEAVTHCAVPHGTAIEAAAIEAGLQTLRCADTRPVYALADAILRCRALVIG